MPVGWPVIVPAGLSRSFRIRSVLFVVLSTVIVVACGSGSSKSASLDPARPQFTVAAMSGGFDLVWNSAKGVPEKPEIEVSSRSPLERGWSTPDGWKSVDLSSRRGESLHFDDVTPQHRYAFRIRGDAGGWSEPIDRLYVETTLPVVRIDTADPAPKIDKDKTYYDGSFTLDPTAADKGMDTIDAPMRIRGRGNSTMVAVPGKKSYQVKFTEKQSVAGLPPSKTWVLLANYLDRSQLRNWTAMQIAEATGLAWTPQSAWVELYFNGDYAGVYQVFEKIDVGKNKVAIHELTPQVTGGDAITGGYLLQLDITDNPGKDQWSTPHGMHVVVQRPQVEDSNDAQFAYIRDHVNRFEAALFSADFTNPESGYRAYLDVDSFIDLWIVQELTANTDAYTGSLYFFKKRGDPKLYFGPAWDFDTSLGSSMVVFADLNRVWFTTNPASRPGPDGKPIVDHAWVIRLFEDPWFRARVAERWHAVVPAIDEIPDRLLRVAAGLDDAKANDMVRWKDTSDTYVRKHRYGDRSPKDAPDYIADWLRRRTAFITDNVDGGEPVPMATVPRPGR